MQMNRMVVTPEMATQWLRDQNTVNRPVSMASVTKYAADMAQGQWRDTHQNAIAFFEDGVLADGQHRLMAVVRSGLAVQMYVAFGLSRSDAMAIDQGRTRSASDALKISGMISEHGHISYAVAMVRLVNSAERPTKKNMTVQEIGAAIEKMNDGIAYALENLTAANGGVKNAVVRAAVAVAYYRVPRHVLDQFCRIMISGMPEDGKDATVITLRNKMMMATHARGGSARLDYYRMTLRFIDAYCKGQVLTRAVSAQHNAFQSGAFNVE